MHNALRLVGGGGIAALVVLAGGCEFNDSDDEFEEPALDEREFVTSGMEEHLSQARAARGRMYLYENASRDGVETRPSGLQIEVLEKGAGETPTLRDTVVTHYKVTSVDGTVLDNSEDYGEPQEFRVDSVIAGWREALQEMKVGSRWKLYVPPELAYGERGLAQIPGGETLVYDLELLGVKRGGPSERTELQAVNEATLEPQIEDGQADPAFLSGTEMREPGTPPRGDASLDTLDLLD